MNIDNLYDGIYEALVSCHLKDKLTLMDSDSVCIEPVEKDDAPDVLSEYLSKLIKYSLSIINERGKGIDEQLRLTNKIVDLLNKQVTETEGNYISDPVEQLKAVLATPSARIIKKKARDVLRPSTSIASSSLFTGASREPSLYSEINKEIETCDRIDMIVSFIRWSGVNLIFDALKHFTDAGNKLRILTTSYMGATEFRAIEKLSGLSNTEIRISFDCDRTRLHAKAYIFYRKTGYSTAYVGSSNLTSPAMTSGCEWNAKITKWDLPEVFSKVEASFEGYWNSHDFEEYTADKRQFLIDALDHQKKKNAGTAKRKYFFDIYPYPYQQAILDRLMAERKMHGSRRNLVIAATGTGKTVLAAFDYKRQCEIEHKKLSLLFVAHRREILEQSIECFREVLKDSEFGELFVGNYSPSSLKHVFISIEMLNRRDLVSSLEPDYYDYIILDECHHAAAKSYQPILDYFTPHIFLGLTATPERMDGEDILPYFNNRIAAEIRLPDAINRKLLCPFEYFCISDSVDLSGLKWSRGGYEKSDLEKVFVFSRAIAEKRAKLIINSIERYVADIDEMKGLVFCVSVEHAKFMADYFNACNIPAEYLTSNTDDKTRQRARENLESGAIKLICVVDLYNEGVDIKQINTVLFLRPTDSITVYLQQLGRGLRLSEGKDCLTVLDFIGHANKKFRYESKFSALLQGSNQGLKNEIKEEFPHLPKGCYIKLEKKAREYILQNIRESVSTKTALINRIISFKADTGKDLNLQNFLTYYSLDPRMIYGQKITLTQYMSNVNIEGTDKEIWKKIYRMTSINSMEFLDFIISMLNCDEDNYQEFIGNGFLNMLYSCFIDQEPTNNQEIVSTLSDYLKNNRVFKNEILDLVLYLKNHVDFIDTKESLPYENALRVHCTYTRAQALASLGYWKTSSEGVTNIKNKKTTCLFITLNKSSSYYSPSTAYHDYSISNMLFHWQSQNATSKNTTVGKRYIHHEEMNETILLFVREMKEDKYGAIAFTFLGKGTYVSHEGNKPMSIIWKLHHPIPASFIDVTDKLGIS